jgi:hypothetical protein
MSTGSTMYPRMWPNDNESKYVHDCDARLVKMMYRDNFGPTVVDSFTVEVAASGGVACSWRVRDETGFGRYVVMKQLSDGTRWIVADSVVCQGAGTVYSVLDGMPDVGTVDYVVSVVDSVEPGVWVELPLGEGYVERGGAESRTAEPDGVEGEMSDVIPGYGSPEEAVRALGVSMSTGENADRARVLADGFTYYVRGGGFWGRAIDGILTRRSRQCVRAESALADTLVFEPMSRAMVSEELVRVRAAAQYVRGCRELPAAWIGEIEALVERRAKVDGWRVREIRELR